MNTTDYIFCEDCNTWVDLWKYDSIEDTGHAQCHWRYARPEELPDLIRDCKDSGCFREQGLCPDCQTPLEHFSGLEHIPEYDYCPNCQNKAYDNNGEVIARLE